MHRTRAIHPRQRYTTFHNITLSVNITKHVSLSYIPQYNISQIRRRLSPLHLPPTSNSYFLFLYPSAAMPLWVFYHPPNTFTDPATKKALAKVLTDGYASVGLPRSYVVVLFQPIEPDSYYIGGVARPSPDVPANKPGPDSTRPFIRIKIEHFARPE
jgi:phenylpyruvate tautomerase PptA (4-oxalocrotonate tautomerase family)